MQATAVKKASPVTGRPAGATSFDPIPAKAFGDAVRERRLAVGIAQEALALKAQVDRGYMGHLERGARQPSLGIILKLAKALGCSASDLLKDAEQRLPKRYLAGEPSRR